MSKDDYQINNDKQSFLKVAAIILVVIGLCLIFKTWIETGDGWGKSKDIQNGFSLWTFRSAIGGFIGGVVGPLFSLAGFFILYLTLQKQNQAFLKERFENKFFELLKLHRENVAEFEIRGSVRGRKCFIAMLNEFHYIYQLTHLGGEITSKIDKHYFSYNENNQEQNLTDLAFKIFFFGVGYNSERQLEHYVTSNEFLFYKDFVKPKLKTIQEAYLNFRKHNTAEYFEYGSPLDSEPDEFTFETICYPFDGHSIRLGHYYRLLFQCVKFVDKQDEILSFSEKQFYINTLRAQLSNQEQLMLYYDSLSEFGKAWYSEDYFKTYSFLKNIPLALVKVKPHPHEKIGFYNELGEFLFEWDKHSINSGKKIKNPL